MLLTYRYQKHQEVKADYVVDVFPYQHRQVHISLCFYISSV